MTISQLAKGATTKTPCHPSAALAQKGDGDTFDEQSRSGMIVQITSLCHSYDRCDRPMIFVEKTADAERPNMEVDGGIM